jgi:hypothetical protein
MKKPADNLMFSSITDMPILDKKQAAKELLAIDKKYYFLDPYRNITMIPLMTKSGNTGLVSANNRINAGEFNWVNIAPQVIVDWFEDIVFPWTGCRARIMALLTMPGEKNYEHIDCDPSELNTQQHKFRLVVQGKTSTLYFITKQGNIYPPEIENAFVMDGGWPHGMHNSTDEIKITLAMGAPWAGNENYTDLVSHLNRQDYQMPDILDQYWNKKYQ